jgi:membrane-bound metal-dependent hydrolase YbcI (DUF457 family)
MENSVLLVFIIKLVLGGIAAFLAILLWSKTRDPAWMCVIAGTIISYAGIVVDMLTSMGMIAIRGLQIADISVFSLIFIILPTLFYIIAFILLINRSEK